jgi:antirestriction protein ArdC
VNANHSAPVQFTTIAHELAHLFLGHLGRDKHLDVPGRANVAPSVEELEAESVAYLVCKRNGVDCKSERYLTDYVERHTTVGDLDIYQVMRAAGQVETLLNLTEHTKYDKPAKLP